MRRVASPRSWFGGMPAGSAASWTGFARSVACASKRLERRCARKHARAAAVALASLVALAVDAQPSIERAPEVGDCRRIESPSARLDCYDRAFPPILEREADGGVAARRGSRAETEREQVRAGERAPNASTGAERPPASADRARIVEVQTPSLTTTVLVAADGRVFVRENSTTVLKWPDAPFDVAIGKARFGSTYVVHPVTRERVRVAVRNE